MNDLSDEHLIGQAIQGSKDSFEQIVVRYSDSLLRFVGRSVPVTQDAEDIVQDVFVNVYTNMHRFDCDGSFKAWLYAIAYNCKTSHLRKIKVRRQVIETESTPQAAPDEIVTQKHEVESIWALADTLSVPQSTALWLRYKEQMDVKEIARVMKKTSVHVRVLLHRARARLADMLNESGTGEE